jgi:hypothetical protein
MSWTTNEKDGFNMACLDNVGQINMNSYFGKYIYDYAKNDNYTTFLEIGTWNGLGSTKCFIEGFRNRSTEYKFYSLECNEEKYTFAKNLYKHINNVHILNEVLLNDMPNDIYEIFPELLENPTFKYWNDIDFENMKNKKLFLERNDVPKFYDIILLDGGEFTTYYEFKKLEDKCKFLLLDDTNVSKCKKIVDEIKLNINWKLVIESNERNGFAIFERVK